MKDKKFAFWTSLIILLPTVLGLLLWDQLPDRLATHWGMDGQPDGWSGKGFAVFGTPLILLVFQWICIWATRLDKQNQSGSNAKVMRLVMCVFPVISVFACVGMYGAVLEWDLGISNLVFVLIGGMFLAIGNYLPKCRQNSTLGIKLPWTFASEENWNKTHRLGGKVWVICGIVILANMVLDRTWVFLTAVFSAVLIPTVYSWLLYRKQKQAGTAGPISKQNKTGMIAAGIITAATLLLVGFVLFTGNIRVDVDDTALTVTADRWDDLTVELEAIDGLELRENGVDGTREWGYGSLRLLMGLFSNEEFGSYTRYTYAGDGPCIVIYSGERVLVLGCETEAQTLELYRTICGRIG